ncbi:sugar ABC transporter permease [Bacillus sp. FJAT-49732]|uniref:Sugar ABC transporter permease n=1 Tax=Lederbergia citrisecunda TaxID=2833583 RepID=A0A942YPD7_9BACI|nr:sugar ABC transporter permease [Lederbergia citrisecunda]MBS4201201.1 sugar ABC transporter permease [Lederbergia citrisecunda]
MKFKETVKAFLYLFPALLIIEVFTIYPIIKSFLMSFYADYDFFNDVVHRYGFDNFVFLWNDLVFHKALKNTLIFVLGVVPISIILSLWIAIMLNSITLLNKFFRAIYFIPFVTSVVAVSIVWRWIFHSNYGIMNYFLSFFGIEPIQWLTSTEWAMPALIILSIWKGLGYNIIIFLAGLQTIGDTYYNAARIDGAKRWNRFIHVTLPQLAPTTFFVSIISIINSFKVFDEIYALFDGKAGPSNSALTVVYYIFDKFYGEWNFGVASAAAYVLFLIIFIITLIQFYINKKKITY